jgi:hypothetical protein
MRRLIPLGIVGVLTMAACTGSPSPAPTHAVIPEPSAPAAEPLVLFDNGGLSFLHPSSWVESIFSNFVSLNLSRIVYLSNEPLHDPCTQTKLPHGLSVSCGSPLETLGPGGVLVTWTAWGRIGGDRSTFSLLPGKLQSIGGHLAKIDIERGGGACSELDADVTVDANFYLNGWNGLGMTACLKDPGLEAAQAQVLALLESTQIPSWPSATTPDRALPH